MTAGQLTRQREHRSTRPIDVAYAGSRVPTASVMLMILRVGTRTTYTTSTSSSTASDDDSFTFATSL